MKRPAAICSTVSLSPAYGSIRTNCFRAIYMLRFYGLVKGSQQIATRAIARISRTFAPPSPHRRGPRDEPLNLQPGEWVFVKAEPEIRATLGSHSRLGGLQFVDEMLPYCGRPYRVHRRMERMLVEHTLEVRTLKATVLLENVFCQGTIVGCDRQCFLYWREAWLRRPTPAELAELDEHQERGAREEPDAPQQNPSPAIPMEDPL